MAEFLGETCSHGIKWACHCRECDLVSAREFVRRWAPLVDEARSLIEAAAPVRDRYVEVFEREGRAQGGAI